jgi:uncharacterized protein with von Willebrand factor type A (vWA) domain
MAALLPNVITFVRLLRQAGLPVAVGQQLAFIEALGLVDIGNRQQVHDAARALLLSRRDDLAAFELVFNRVWRAGAGTSAVRARRQRPAAGGGTAVQGSFTIASYDAFRARELEREVEVEDRRGTWSAMEVLRSRRFAEMSPEELDALRRLMQSMDWRAAERRTRRLRPATGGRWPDLRRALRGALRHGGLVVQVPRREARVVERPVVFLADISGSMERHSRIVLQFLHAAVRKRRHVEVFVFGTRLTRLTARLRVRNVDRAIAAAAAEVVDWAGGTRIGDSLREFNRRWSRRVLRRGAIVVILSDGLDRGDEASLRREMRLLRGRAHRVIWLNPLAGTAGWAPTAAGMASAREFVDDLLPAHDLDALERFLALLRSVPARRPTRRSGVTPSARLAGGPEGPPPSDTRPASRRRAWGRRG